MTRLRLVMAAAAALGAALVLPAGTALAANNPFNSDAGYKDDSYEPYRDNDDYGDDRRHRHHRKKRTAYPPGCTATIRAAGKRNVFYGFARNSAIFAWRRETQAVHGRHYARWHLARNKTVVCNPAGGLLTLCVAKARPCEF